MKDVQEQNTYKQVLFDLYSYTDYHRQHVTNDNINLGTATLSISDLEYYSGSYTRKILNYIIDHLDRYIETSNIKQQYISDTFRNLYKTPCIKFKYPTFGSDVDVTLFITNIKLL